MKKSLRERGCAIAFVGLLAGCGTEPAQRDQRTRTDLAEVQAPIGRIYWATYGGGENGAIYCANPDGSNARALVTTPEAGIVGIAVDSSGGKMYWIDLLHGSGTGTVRRANLDGSNIEILVSLNNTGAGGGANSITLDTAAGKVYWSDQYGTGFIYRANLDGSGVETVFRVPAIRFSLAIDPANGKIYWSNSSWNTIERASLDGSSWETLLSGLSAPIGIALDVARGTMYLSEDVAGAGMISRANLDGSGLQNLIGGLPKAAQLALDLGQGKVYWDGSDGQGSLGKIQRANLDGSGVEDVITGIVDLKYLALETAQVELSVRSASVVLPPRGTTGAVQLRAGFTPLSPESSDVIFVSFDGVPLFAEPLSSFIRVGKSQTFILARKWVVAQFDFQKGQFFVNAPKADLANFKPPDGVIVKAGIGAVSGQQAIAMRPKGRYRWVYDCVPPPHGMVSWWRGSNGEDSVGPNSGDLLGGTAIVPGNVGQAFGFDGVNDLVAATDIGLPLGAAPRTVELWMKPNFNARVPFLYGAPEPYDAFYPLVWDAGVCIGQWGGWPPEPCGWTNVTDGNWHHIAMTYDGTAARLYVDGVLEVMQDKLYATSSNGKAYLGSTVASQEYFQGLVDEVTVYKRALRQEEVLTIFEAGSAGKCAFGH